jgi:HAL2 family 3'(2'),5'-bisphosphate nucleotidase
MSSPLNAVLQSDWVTSCSPEQLRCSNSSCAATKASPNVRTTTVHKRQMNSDDEASMMRLLAAAKAAVRAACRVTASVQQGAFSHISKPDASPVTVADFAAQAVVTIVLRHELLLSSGAPLYMMGEEDEATFRSAGADTMSRVAELVQGTVPKAAFMATTDVDKSSVWSVEEVAHVMRMGSYSGAQQADGSSRPSFWVLDPVDGTKGFLRRGQYAVGLAYISRGSVSLAVIGCPNLPFPALVGGLVPGSLATPGAPQAASEADAAVRVGTLCSAISGGGAFQEALEPTTDEAATAPMRLRVSTLLPSSPSFLVAQSFDRSDSDAAACDRLCAHLSIVSSTLRLDSMVKYCLVARGEASLYFRLLAGSYRECIWDHAPGSLLVTEAGGASSDVFGAALDFSHGQRLTQNVGIIACNGAAHAAVLDALEKTLPGDVGR